MGTPLLWVGFNLFVLFSLALDLGVFHRKAHKISIREATFWSAVWIALALAFGYFIWHWHGPQRGLEYFTGYVIEKALSVDNLFLQTTLQTDYLHGKLEPRVTMILDVQGIFAFAPALTYRINDSFLFSGTYLAIEGSRRAGLAVFRGHDMVQLRLTYQLN